MTEVEILNLSNESLDAKIGELFGNRSEWVGLSASPTNREPLRAHAAKAGIPIESIGHRIAYKFSLPSGEYEIVGGNETEAMCRAILLHKLKVKSGR